VSKQGKQVTIAILAALLIISFFIDETVAGAVIRLHTQWLTSAVTLFTRYFSWIYFLLITATIIFAVKVAKKNAAWKVTSLIASVIATVAVTLLLKFIFHRERPNGISMKIFSNQDFSLPSNHAAITAAGLFSSPDTLRIPWLALTVLTMFSRLYLGVHFLSDTVAGLLVAAIVSFFIQNQLKAGLNAEDVTELKRQALHFVIGLAIAAFVWRFPSLWYVLVLIAVLGFTTSYTIKASAAAKNRTVTKLRRFAVALLSSVERKKELERFPGKGAIMLFLGAGITAAIFRQEAVPAIVILAVGDSLGHLAGRLLGKIRHRGIFESRKMVEGTAWGIILAAGAASTIAPVWAAITASVAAMLAEAARIRMFGRKIDDNLTVPLVAAAVMWLIRIA